jgi:DNA-binding XRE family transcriptional regulator
MSTTLQSTFESLVPPPPVAADPVAEQLISSIVAGILVEQPEQPVQIESATLVAPSEAATTDEAPAVNPSDDFNNLKPWLEKHLALRSMSIEQLANASDLTRASIYFYMNDRARPSAKAIGRICIALNVSIEEGLAQYTMRKRGRKAGKK